MPREFNQSGLRIGKNGEIITPKNSQAGWHQKIDTSHINGFQGYKGSIPSVNDTAENFHAFNKFSKMLEHQSR